jgi:hypothetical protein
MGVASRKIKNHARLRLAATPWPYAISSAVGGKA